MTAPWLTRLASCPSTNTWAKDRLPDLTHGSVVWAETQTAGRGQHGRQWHSYPGVLTFSVVLHLNAPARQLGLIAGLAVAQAIEQALPSLQPALKWPNDVMLGERKVAGILCEGRSHGAGMSAVVGIGLNHTVDFAQTEAGAWCDALRPPIALIEATADAATVPASTLIADIRQGLLEGVGLLQHRGIEPLLPELRRRDWLEGRSLQLTTSSSTISGIGAGLDSEGCLLLAGADGGLISIDGGRIIEASGPNAASPARYHPETSPS